MDMQLLIQYGIIALVLIIILLIVIKLNRKDFNLEINKLVKYLGGKDNILDTEVNMSRFKVTLKDVTKVDKEGIKSLGAKGIVEIDNQLKIIFGADSKALKKYVDEIRK
ncbi:MAG TPA: PTS transporter subunit EIIB [Bacilli bacterium]|jgi:glucose-like phosphotransferase system IIB component|nr:PTS transporter subunit EIIB [Bacilli bacterium]HPZ23926.1 PTS transporter subunit EIIB [Bacilli bacterium]HQC83883.1 PTS transporter subunit EIIB [Bacilli bacterium]